MAQFENTKMASEIIEAVGGKGNVAAVTHCMTRLRFNLKDEAKSSDDAINKVAGVIKVIHAGNQVQVVIGQGVDRVYDEVCNQLGGLSQAEEEGTAGNGKKKKLTPKVILNNILGALSGSITPILPVFIVAGIFKMIAVLLGPSNAGLLSEESQLYQLCNLVNDGCFYFMPFFAAYSAAQKFKASPILSMILAAVMLHPNMLAIVSAGEPFSIYGLFPMHLVNYTQAVIPIVLIVWVLSYVEKWVKKIVPDFIRVLGVPTLTVAIMLPLALCVFGPICYVVMGWVADMIVWLNNTVGILAMVVVGATWPLVITFGMHVPVMTALLPAWLTIGYDSIVSPASIASGLANLGVELSYALRANSKEARALGWSCLTSNALANIGEPYLYGIFLRDKRALVYQMIGGASGALVMGILGAKIYIFSGVGFPWLNFLRFGEDAILGAVGMAVAFAVPLGLGLVFGYEKSKE